jgi:hypothetical protein
LKGAVGDGDVLGQCVAEIDQAPRRDDVIPHQLDQVGSAGDESVAVASPRDRAFWLDQREGLHGNQPFLLEAASRTAATMLG